MRHRSIRRVGPVTATLFVVVGFLVAACTPGSGGSTPQPPTSAAPAGQPASSVAPAPSASGGKAGY